MRLTLKAAPEVAVCQRRSRMRRVLRRALHIKLGLAFALALVASLALLRLVAGPVSLRDYSERVAEMLAGRLGPGWGVALTDTELELNGARPAVRTTGLEIRNPAGLVVVRAPQAIVTLDVLSLVSGSLALREIELRDLDIRAAMAADGRLSFLPPSGPGTEAAPGPAPSTTVPSAGGGNGSALSAAVASLIDPILRPVGLVGGLDRAKVTGARLTLVGADGRERVAFNRVDALFERADGVGRRIELDLAGARGSWRVGGFVREDGEGRRSAEIEAALAPVDDVLLLAGLSGLPAGTDLKVTGRISAALVGERLDHLSGRFETTPGIISPATGAPLRIDQMFGSATWNEDRRRLDLSEFVLRSGPSAVALAGEVLPGEDGAWRLKLGGRNAGLDGVTSADDPFTIAEIDAEVSFQDSTYTLDRLHLRGDALDLRVSGASVAAADGLGLRTRIEADGTAIRRLLRLWPEDLNRDLRTYLVENLRRGTLDRLRLKLDLSATDLQHITSARPIADAALALNFSLSEAELNILEGLPALRKLAVEGRSTGTTVFLASRGGRLEMPDGRRLAFLDGTYDQSGLDKPGSTARIGFRLDGGADALASLLRQPTFRDLASFDLNPAQIKGRADLRVTLPLDPKHIPQPADLVVTIGGTLADISVDKIFGRERLEGGNFAVAYEGGSLSLKGEGRLGGTAAAIDLRQPRKGAGEVLVALTLDDASRVRRSLPSSPQLTGPVPVKLTLPLGGPKPVTRVEADLSRAGIDGLLPGWAKPAGRPGRLTFALADGDTAELRDIVLDAGPVQLRGGAVFAADGALEKADLPQVKLSPGDDLRVHVERAAGVYRVGLRGNVGDARPVLKWMTGGPPGAGAKGRERDSKDFDLDLQVNILTGFNDEALTGVQAKLSSRNREVRALQMRGQFRSAPFDAQVARRDGGPPTLTVQTADAGATLRFLDLYRRMAGGELRLQAALTDGTQTGSIRIDKFALRNEPALRRIAAGQPIPGASEERGGNPLSRLEGEQVYFTRLTGEFQRSASRVDYKDVVIYGAQVGFNVSGFVDYALDRTDISGTFVPAYGLNNVFSQVPIVGIILGGDKNEGLFAIDFRVAGPASAPTLTVNPLTAVTPGILRKLFGWTMPDGDEPAATASQR